MSDHERIWLQPLCCVDEGEDRQWCEDNVWPMDDCDAQGVEYIRADLVRQASPPISRVDEYPTDCACPPEPMAHDPLYQCTACEQRQIDNLEAEYPTEESRDD